MRMISSGGFTRRVAGLAGIVLAAALLLTACGGSDDDVPAPQVASQPARAPALAGDGPAPSPDGNPADEAVSQADPSSSLGEGPGDEAVSRGQPQVEVPGYGDGASASTAGETEVPESTIDPRDAVPSGNDLPDPIPPRDGISVGALVASEVILIPHDAAAHDEFGWSADVDGDRAISGAPFHDDQGYASGTAYIFERRMDDWVQVAELLPEDGEAGIWFGRWAAIEGDVAVVGAPAADVVGDDDDAGAAYVFQFKNGAWRQHQRLIAGNPRGSEQFGWTVAISGDVIVVSASNEADGGGQKVYVFRRYGGWWLREAELVASDGASGDFFGLDLDVSGDTIVVGAKGRDSFAGINAGAAYVFQRGPEGWLESAKLEPNDAYVFDFFGRAVAIAGDTIVVGAYLEDAGAPDGGSVYVFRREADGWRQQVKLIGPGTEALDYFGYDVATDGETIVVGVPRDDSRRGDVAGAGSAVIYRRDGDDWRPLAQIWPTDVVASGEGADYGWTTAVASDVILIGAWLADTEAGPDAGRAYVYRLPPE